MAKMYAGSAGERVADLRAERERCARIADEVAAETGDGEGEIYIARKIADRIRALNLRAPQ